MNEADNISTTVDKLNGMDVKVADDLLSILLLYSIPNIFVNFQRGGVGNELLRTSNVHCLVYARRNVFFF
ncbi:hypothetical protein WH47_07753 [Habropoda laboriosa]|uniref:Uncharacterized protein n=1 Tax=Habropoda laboriosa TaxID=597456 RepID=A0A0L7QNV5_9HYME|nr:hypothetical protein WH47_07753 [Habropoda laboriosa]